MPCTKAVECHCAAGQISSEKWIVFQTELVGRLTEFFAEAEAEVIGVTKTAFHGNFRKSFITGQEHIPGVLQTQIEQIIRKGFLHDALERAQKGAFTAAENLCRLPPGHRMSDIVMDEIQHFIKFLQFVVDRFADFLFFIVKAADGDQQFSEDQSDIGGSSVGTVMQLGFDTAEVGLQGIYLFRREAQTVFKFE